MVLTLLKVVGTTFALKMIEGQPGRSLGMSHPAMGHSGSFSFLKLKAGDLGLTFNAISVCRP